MGELNINEADQVTTGGSRVKETKIFLNVRATLSAGLPVLFLTATYLRSEQLMTGTIILLTMLLLVSIPAAKGMPKFFGFTLLGLAAIILLFSGGDLTAWRRGLGNNIDLISLFLTVPLLSIPLKYGNYLDSAEALFRRKIRKNYQVYGFSMIITYMLGAVFNMASLHIVNQLFGQKGHKMRQELISLASLRGFTACIFWSPTFFSVGIVLSATGVRWLDIFPIGITLSLAILAVGLAMDVLHKKWQQAPEVMVTDIPNAEEEDFPIDFTKLFELLVLGGMLLVGTVALHTWLNISILILVPTVAILFPPIWMVYLKKTAQLPRIAREYYREELPKHTNEVVLFSGAGLFGAALASSQVSAYLAAGLERILGGGPLLTVMIISISIILPFMVGINPVISITVIMSTLQQQNGAWDPFFLALGMLVGWSTGIIISPFAAVNLTVASLVNKSPFHVSIRNNYLYAILALLSSWLIIGAIF